MAGPLFIVVNFIFTAFWWILIASIIMSWLIAFGIVSPHNPNVRATQNMLDRFTEPFLAPIRKIIPPVNGLDFSVLVALLLLQYLIQPLVYQALFSLTAGHMGG